MKQQATFQVCGIDNRYNCRECESGHPYHVTEHERDSSKVNVWCATMKTKLLVLFYF
jgi:hypothetical protein